MRNRRLVMSAVLVAAGVGLGVALIPGAARGVDPAEPPARGVAAPVTGLAQARAANVKTFSSPGDRTVRSGLPAAKSTTAGAPPARAQAAAGGNEGLEIHLGASTGTAHGLSLESRITSEDTALDVVVDWGDGKKEQATASGSTTLKHRHVYAKTGTYTVTVTVTDAAHNVRAVNSLPYVTPGSDFSPHAPTRLLDTRDGTGAPKAGVGAYSSVRVKVASRAEIPAGATAVVLNVTVTNTRTSGHVTAFPGRGYERPATSNVNYTAGQTVPNLVIVPIGEDGYVELYNGGWEPVDLIADVTGYYTRTAAGGYVPLDPVRLADTRSGTGTAEGQVAGYTSFDLQVHGSASIPAAATAVALNVTATGPKDSGHLTAYPSGRQPPSTSSVNYGAGQTVANSVIVPIGADGRISIRNGGWDATDVVVDVVGYYSPDSNAAYMPLDPARLLDTRSADWKKGPLRARTYAYLGISPGEAGIAGYVLNATVTHTRGAGFLSVSPDPNTWDQNENGSGTVPERPVSSTLNWTTGATVPNLVQASSGDHGVVDFWNQGWEDTDLIVDLFGYYETK
ncbi:PKD domain-containing protein [Streptomyces sp. NPDC055254]